MVSNAIVFPVRVSFSKLVMLRNMPKEPNATFIICAKTRKRKGHVAISTYTFPKKKEIIDSANVKSNNAIGSAARSATRAE